MFEIKRVLLNRKIVLITLILCLLNAVMFSLNCSENKLITITGDDLSEYVNIKYFDFLENTSEQAKQLEKLDFMNSGSSYAKKNISKSDSDYKNLHDVVPEIGENRGIVAFSNFRLSDIIFIGILLLIAFTFAEESKKGLVYLVRVTVNGRGRLSVFRILSLLIGAVALCFLIYGGSIITAEINFGGTDFSRAIQSVPEFMRCPFKISIGQYLFFSSLIKCISGFAVSVLFYLLTGILGTFFTAICCAVFSASSFIFYSFILPTDSLNILKFANIFTLIKTDDLFKEYCNINIFGSPVGMMGAAVCILLFLLTVMLVLTLVVNSFFLIKPSFGFTHSMFKNILTFLSRKSPQLPLFFWEGYKILIKQKGVFFLIICFYLTLSAALDYRYLYPVDRHELEWHKTFDGVINEELVMKMRTKDAELAENIVYFEEKNIEAVLNGYSPARIQEISDMLDELINKKRGLEPVLAQAEDGYSYFLESGKEVWLIKPYSYRLLLVDDEKTVQRNNIYIMLGIIGAIAGITAVEKQFSMSFAIKTTKNGRTVFWVSKIIWVLIITVVFAVSVHLIQFLQVGAAVVYSSPEAPIHSLDFMRSFPFNIPINGYFMFLFAMRALAAFLCGLFVTVISGLRSDKISVMGICVFCLVVPYMLLSA